MNKYLIALTLTLSSTAMASDVAKSGYQLAMYEMSPIGSVYGFILDQYLETRCGKEQTLDSMKYDPKTFLQINMHLADGQYTKAKKILATIPCSNIK
jgi:hypothetical protein